MSEHRTIGRTTRDPWPAAAHRQGFVLPAVLFGIVVMSVLGVASLRATGDEQLSVQAFRESSLSLFAAEAGLRRTIGTWPTSTVNTMSSGDSLNLGWQSLPNGARYRTVIHQVDYQGLQVYLVIVQGRGARGNAGQRTIEAVIAATPVFKYGVFATGSLSMGNNQISDGFNSDASAYNALTADSTGDIAAAGNITLGPTVVKGNATAGGTATNTSLVTGSVTQTATSLPTYANLNCPSGGFTPASSIPSQPNVTYDATTGVLTLTSDANLILTGTQYYFSAVNVSGQATLTVSNGTLHTDIYIANQLSLTGGGLINVSTKAPQLSLLACGSPSSPATWTVAGGAGAYYAVYAPNHDVQVSGNGDIFGAILGKNVSFSGNGKIHYDAALLNNKGTTLTVVGGSWVELTLY
jgi:hypothetical protein